MKIINSTWGAEVMLLRHRHHRVKRLPDVLLYLLDRLGQNENQ